MGILGGRCSLEYSNGQLVHLFQKSFLILLCGIINRSPADIDQPQSESNRVRFIVPAEGNVSNGNRVKGRDNL